MSIEITLKKELSDQFVSDVMVTAFDGQYGGCWDWAEPDRSKSSWLEVEHPPSCDHEDLKSQRNCTDALWTVAHVKFRDGESTGNKTLDSLSADGIKVDAEVIRIGIQRILDGTVQLADHLREQISRSVAEDDADIDSWAADCIVQVGWFGEAIFS